MKYSRELLIPLFVMAMGISLAGAPGLCAQPDNSNECCLKIALTNAAVVFTISDQQTNSSGPFDLFFKTNLIDSSGWTWLFRYPVGQTNMVTDNLPQGRGFFMLGVTNAIRPGYTNNALPPEDDSPSSMATMPLTINFYGTWYSNVWVNENGNVTFDNTLSTYTPGPLNGAGVSIIAPYWADVDSSSPASDVVTYGTNMVNGQAAFGVDWVNVGYYAARADRLLSCQLVMIDRSDIAPGDFDMEFNYFKVQWEWGSASVGSPPRAGFSDGGTNDLELPGSGVEGALMDTNAVTGLIYNHLNSPVPGRYVFIFRDGQPLP